jgi:4'-phosphopantetheinyl transferase
VTPGEVHVWTVRLNDWDTLPVPPTPGETARAARFRFDRHRQQYLRSHSALRAILAKYTAARLDFAVAEAGKPYLPLVPNLRFNLSHSHEMALVGVAHDVEVGVDVEWIRPLSDYATLAERFFPPSQAAEVVDELDFFLRWTRIEAALKARGVGIYAAGTELEGPWTIEQIDVGAAYTAAVALPVAGIQVVVHEFGAER